MKRLVIFILIFLINMSMISSLCEGGQIDINSASLKELQKIIQIGEKRAKQIIELREEGLFESVDDLIKVKGIGEKTLNKIKEQGLACVNEEKEEDIEKEPEEKSEEQTQIEENEKEIVNNNFENISEKIELDTINLNTKDIKIENNKEINKTDYIKYGFVVFCALIGILFMFGKRKKYKTEFDEDER